MPLLKDQKGNALWFILIIVVLFGALSAALSRNTGKVNQAGDIEQARVRATAILRYTTSVQTAIEKMMLQGLSENSLSFKALGSDYENGYCTDESCEVFSTAGGGIPHRNLASLISDKTASSWIVSAQNFVYLAGCNDANSTCTDLLMIAPDIPEDICLQVNAVQRITNPDGLPPQMSAILTDIAFDGTFTPAINNAMLGGNGSSEATEAQGKSAACVDVGGTYTFYQLLLAR